MLTEIWSSVTDTIFCHFRPFFALLPHYWPRKLKFGKNAKNTWRYCPLTLLYDKWQSYDVWFLRYQARQKEFFVILGYFLPFYPSNSWKNENFKKKTKKKKKTPGNIITLQKCTKTQDHMLYCSWDVVCDGCNYISFWAIFCCFTPLTDRKIKISRKWKNTPEISSFYTSVPKIMIICYTVLEIWHMTDVIIAFHFRHFFCPFTSP